MKITNACIFLPEGCFRKGTVEILDERIASVDLTERADKEAEIDAGGDYLLPGFIDLHFHGAKGADVCDASLEAVRTVADYELKIGVTSICPATLTLPLEELKEVLRCLAAFRKLQEESKGQPMGAELLGINMEGPFISPVKKGAQDERYILPRSSAVFRELQEAAGGLVRFIGLAPEEKSKEPLETFLKEVMPLADVSLAHTNATYEEAKAAFDAGANHVVHLYNGMRDMAHREPGCAGAAADSPHVFAELISDGIHVHPSVVRSTFRMFGKERIVLISDSLRAVGLGDGPCTIGGLPVEVRGKTARLTRDGTIAGSVTPLPECVRSAAAMGIPLEEAVAAATVNPARCLHVEDRLGRIAAGYQADLVLWGRDLSLKRVMKKGYFV